MNLASHQVYELMDYVHEIRKQFIKSNETTDKVFITWNNGMNFYSITQMMLQHLRKINSRIKNLDQIRASVITGWLRVFDIRKVQYLAGHKYVSSTEDYKANVIDELQDDVTKYHPLWKKEYSPTHSTAMPRRRRRGIIALLPPFFMSWFLQLTHLHYFIFLQLKSVIEKMYLQKK